MTFDTKGKTISSVLNNAARNNLIFWIILSFVVLDFCILNSRTRETIYPFVRKLIAREKFTKVKDDTDSSKVVWTVTRFTAESYARIPHKGGPDPLNPLLVTSASIVPTNQLGIVWNEMERKFRYGRCQNGMEDNLPYQFHTRFRAL